MKVNYILADTTKKSTTMALKAAVAEAEKDVLSNIIIIVPETKSIIIEKELLSLTKNGAVANIFVYSFVRLLSRVGDIDSSKMLSREACIVLIRKIIFENLNKLNCYKKSAKSLGFAEKIYDTISQLKSSNISPNELTDKLSEFSETLKLKLSDIVLLYDEYQKQMQNKFFDDCDRLNQLKTFATSSEMIKDSSVYVMGFDSITYEMEEVLNTVAKNSKTITFSCVYFAENRKDKYIQNNELYNKYKHIGDDLKQAYVPSFYKTFESGDFYSIANYLFSTENVSVKSRGNAKVFEAKTLKNEIEFIADTIIAEVVNGKRFKDIGVLSNGLEDNKQIIEETFNRYNIPYFINISHDISSHFFVKFITGAYNIYLKHLSQSDVLSFVSSPLFDDENKSAFFNFVKASGISRGAFLNYLAEINANENDKNLILKVLDLFKDFYLKFESKIKLCKTVKDFASLNNFIFEYFDIENKLAKISEKQCSYKETIEAEISKVIFEKNKNFTETLLNFMSDSEVSANEFLQIYLSGYSSLKVNLSPVSIDCVVIQENTDGFFDIKDLFICNAIEGRFPKMLEDKGIILDSEIDETIGHIKKRLEPSVSTINARERFKAYEALLEAKEKLYVSYSLKSDGSSSSKPARIVLRLMSLFNNDIKFDSYKPNVFVNSKSSEMDFARHVGEYLECGQGLVDLNEEYSKISLSSKFNDYLSNLNFSVPNFEILNAKDIYFYNNATSISQLEKYFACPYRFFGIYGLRIKQNKDAKLSKLDIGTIIHRVVELFSKDISSYKSLNDADFDTCISKLLLKAQDELNVNDFSNKAVLKLIDTECKNLCRNILNEQQISNFKISRTELEFDGTNAQTITLDSGEKINIHGKIDRIDKMGENIRVVDYKTGDVSSSLSGIYYGKKIQLASYLSAVECFDNSKPAGLFYLPVHSDFSEDDNLSSHYKMKGFLLDDIDVIKHFDTTLNVNNPKSNFVSLSVLEDKESNLKINKLGNSDKFLSNKDFENLKNYTNNLSKGAISEILSGYIEPSPVYGLTECKYCEFAGFCGLSSARFSNGRKLTKSVKTESFYNEQSCNLKEDGDGN